MTDVSTGRAADRRELLERRLRRGAAASAAIPRRPEGTVPPLSYAQERLWFMEQFAPGTAANHVTAVLPLDGDVDPGQLERAVAAVVARHESLRMRFPADADGRPLVVVAPTLAVQLEVVDIAGLDSSAYISERGARPFDVADGPLFRTALVRDRNARLLCLEAHHLVSDGWSTDLVVADLLAAYEAVRAGREPVLAEPPLRYGDYAAWERRGPDDAARRDLDYWCARLAGVTPLDLPTDRPRPATQVFDGATHRFTVPRAVVDPLVASGRERGATSFMTLLAGYLVLLSRYAGRTTDFAVGTPVAGRGRPELEGIVGMFVNMLALRADLSGAPTFAELVDRVRDTALTALAHADTPLGQLVDALGLPRDVSRSPLFQVSFAMHNFGTHSRTDSTPTAARWAPVEIAATRFDLELHVAETADGLWCELTYNTALFDKATANRIADHYAAVLADAATDPHRPVDRLCPLTPAERHLVLSAWTDTDGQVSADATIPMLIAKQAAATPDAVAVADDTGAITYRELDSRSRAAAARLRERGIGPEALVAVCAERAVELVVGLLGVLRAGAGYVPLDPEYPVQRLAFMLEDSAAPVLLTQPHLRERLPDTTATVVDLAEITAASASSAPADGQAAGPDNLAYVIYTSGSTGQPKGVANAHRGVVNRLDWMQRQYRLGAHDAVLHKTPISFDVSVWELFWPLVAGARLVLAKPGGHRDAAYLRDTIARHGVTTAHFVPSMLAALLAEEGLEGCASLRTIICSGEELPLATARRCVEALPGAALHNLYGPTEAAIDVSWWPCEPAALQRVSRVPIGRPIQNIRLYVLDELMAPVPVGVPGELYIGGVGVARGYHRRPALTAERFVPDPYGGAGGRLYRTGDAVRWRPDGTLEFLGRLDGQVKLRGQRIELGEIEAALRDLPGVREAVVLVREDTPGDRRLVGYLVADPASEPAAVRAALQRRLPEYMVPAAYVTVDALPVTANGKLDRSALPAPARQAAGSASGSSAPTTEVERIIAGVWQEVLDLDAVGADDDFFDLGGHSLLAVQVVARLRRALPPHVPRAAVTDVFAHRTVRELAAYLDQGDGPRSRRLLHELTRTPAGQRVLSYICVPYGGGSAVVFQPLADALPAGHALYAVAIPGHDVGLDEDALPFDDLAARCTAEILERVDGPLALYGHCGVGSALIVELGRRLEAAGREVSVVYIGGMFPFARPNGALGRVRSTLDRLVANRNHATWLTSMGVDMGAVDRDQAERIISNMRRDGDAAEEYFTTLQEGGATPLRAPIVSVVGNRDPVTEYHEERYREWGFLSGTTALVVLDQAGHFFLRYRAEELAEIVTRTHRALAGGDAAALHRDARPGQRWWLHAPPATAGAAETGIAPSMARFVRVALGQLVSLTGSALLTWAIPVYIYLRTGSLNQLAILAVSGLLPGLAVSPLAGAIVDRLDRRKVMLGAVAAAGAAECAFGALFWTDRLQVWHLYILIMWLAVAASFQRLAFTAAIPQVVPKRFLGHATGLAQLAIGFAMVVVPLLAAGLLTLIGLGGILLVDIASFAVVALTLAVTRFPDRLGRLRKEPLLVEIVEGFRYCWRHSGLRHMLLLAATMNVFLAPLMILVSPLVLSFGRLGDIGVVTFLDALGTVVGAVAMTVWGGPARLRMRTALRLTLVMVAFLAVIGLRGSVAAIGLGFFGTAAALTLIQSIYTTIVQVKVAQRFHGRVYALMTALTWSTLPIGWALTPVAVHTLEPLLRPGGALAGTVGAVLGVGPGRGIGLFFVLLAGAMTVITLIAMRLPAYARFDDDVPDAEPDDLFGAAQAPRTPEGAMK
jgi:amino acid adenylation domain-containing protein